MSEQPIEPRDFNAPRRRSASSSQGGMAFVLGGVVLCLLLGFAGAWLLQAGPKGPLNKLIQDETMRLTVVAAALAVISLVVWFLAGRMARASGKGAVGPVMVVAMLLAALAPVGLGVLGIGIGAAPRATAKDLNAVVDHMQARQKKFDDDSLERMKAMLPMIRAADIAADSTLGQSRKRLADMKAILTKYRDDYEGLTAAARDELNNLNIHPQRRAVLMDIIDARLSKSEVDLKGMRDADAATVSEAGAALDVLAAHRGGWRIQDGKLVFTDMYVWQAYQWRVERIAYYMDTAQNYQHSYDRMRRDIVDDLRKYAAERGTGEL